MEVKIYKQIILLGIFLLLLIGCNASDPTPALENEEIEKLTVPTFSIHIRLTQAARNKLKSSGETIKGSVYFDGDGTPLPDVKTAPFRDVYLGKVEFETKGDGIVTISNAVISTTAHSRLSDKNYHYFVNVYSGRHVFENNILSGGYAQGRFHDLEENKTITISCDLL